MSAKETKKLTPAMRQYMEMKDEHSDSILFFRMGDFYEMFFDDAVVAARVLGIALTTRDKDRSIPMCGVPYHAAQGYIARLVKEGYGVAVCEQIEDPSKAKGIVERAVTRVITPGVAFEDELLDPKSNNFIAAALPGDKASGFAYMDASTGEFRVTEFKHREELVEEVRRIRPLELLVPEASSSLMNGRGVEVKKTTPIGDFEFDHGTGQKRLSGHFGVNSLDGFGCGELTAGVSAAGVLLGYIQKTQGADPVQVRRLIPYHTSEHLVLDSSTRRNLEILENTRTGGKVGTLVELLDRTRTALGGRCLRGWLTNPLKDHEEITRRQAAVEELFSERTERRKVQGLLAGVYDLERLITRVCLGVANPRDLASLKASLEAVPEVRSALGSFSAPVLSEISAGLDGVPEVVTLVKAALADDPPVNLRDGGVIREGYSRELDELREVGSGGRDWIARLEAKERERTGISSLKVGYNKVFGYYIEITKANLASVPEEYTRKQTLVNAERFITPELKEWEEKILTSEEKARVLEAELFTGLRKKVSGFADRIQATADVVAALDAICSLAEVSQAQGYTRPEVDGSTVLEIEGGRHPVIEASGAEDFVSNDLALDPDSSQVIILTGPNMAGKSTYLRQTALIVLMAQIGCFVPASRARIGAADRIFTRIGASDDLTRGQSTFMVEMNETANILNNATPRSLVILDEIGRGTSTFDGLSIAWAVVEYLHDHPASRPRTLFATHYHELTDLSLTKERVKNYNMAVKEWQGEIIFLRKVVPGGSSRSYGIQVAKLAGLPGEVIRRSGEILENLESGELDYRGEPRFAVHRDHDGGPADGEDVPAQMNLLGEGDELREELSRVDIDSTTPLEALETLNRLKQLMKD